MKRTALQYEYELIGTGYTKRATVFVTAYSESDALKAVTEYHGTNFAITQKPLSVGVAHRVYGEIDCT